MISEGRMLNSLPRSRSNLKFEDSWNSKFWLEKERERFASENSQWPHILLTTSSPPPSYYNPPRTLSPDLETSSWSGRKKTGPRKPNERAAGFRETATFEKEEKEKEERKGIKREKWSGRRWRERGKESGLERRADRDGRGIHSPRVMRSSPPGGMNEL